MRRHPFELLVGDYLSMPTGKGGFHTLGLFLDMFSQHLWVTKFKTAGMAKTTVNSLNMIFNTFTAVETFMTDGGKHFNNTAVKDFCAKWSCEHHVVTAYSPWVNGLVEGTNKLLLHVLKRLCAPELGEDEHSTILWDKPPKTWPDHLDNAVRALNNRLLPALKHTPKELLLSLVVDTKCTIPTDSITPATDLHAAVHMVYVAQQCLDGYDKAMWHALKRKTLFDKRVLQWCPGGVVFGKGELVQVYHSDLDYTFKTEHKLLPKWSQPHQVTEKLPNSYKLETLTGLALPGLYHAQCLRTFIPCKGTQLHASQQDYICQLHQQQDTNIHKTDGSESMEAEMQEERGGQSADTATMQVDEEAVESDDKEH